MRAKMKITQKNFTSLIESLNHRMTRIESDVKWMRRIGYYMATLLTVIAIKTALF